MGCGGYQASGAKRAILLVLEYTGIRTTLKEAEQYLHKTASSRSDESYYDTKIENVPRMKAVGEGFRKAREKFFWNKYGKDQHQLMEMGTHPNHRRKGAARMMLKAGQDKAANKNVAITLFASPMGRAMYEHFGFSDRGEGRVQVEGEKEYLDILCMAWEPPKQKEAAEYVLISQF